MGLLSTQTINLHQPLNAKFPYKFLNRKEHMEAPELSILKWMCDFLLFSWDFLFLANDIFYHL